MASGTKEKGLTANEPARVQKKLGISQSRNGLKDFETWMDTGYQLCQEDSLKFLEEIKKWMPENASQLCSKVFEGFETEQKQRMEMEQFAEEEMRKKLESRSAKDFQKKSYDEGDQSPLVGRDAWILQKHWSTKMDYSPFNPFLSKWMKVIFTGNYKAMMDILRKTPDVKKLLSMRESLMNVPAVIHVFRGATLIHAEEPSLLEEKRQLQMALKVNYDHLKILEKLIKLGADLSARDVAGMTVLHYYFTSHTNPTTRAMNELVLKAGLDPNIQDRYGYTPLYFCAAQKNLADIELLLKFGANPGIKEFEKGDSCLDMARWDPAMNKLVKRFTCKDALRERNKLKEENGGSLSKCLECGKDKAERCKGCFVAHYCGKVCQKKGWKAHRSECRATRAKYVKATVVSDSPFLNFIPPRGSAVDEPDLSSETSFALKVIVLEEEMHEFKFAVNPLGQDTLLPILVHNRGQNLKGALFRTEGQEEFYDKLKKEVLKKGFNRSSAFFPAIYQKNCTDGRHCNLEINPDQMLPLEIW